jgi:hypothetical protein
VSLALAPAERTRLRSVLAAPDLFIERFLRASLWGAQRWLCQAVATHQRTAVKACHATGKTFTLGRLVLWWVTYWHAMGEKAIVVTTGPSWNQVKRQLWGETRAAAATAAIYYDVHTADLQISEDVFAIGLSTNDTSRFSGYHATHVLIIIDEGQGVRPGIFEAIEGIRAGGDVRVVMTGNPTVIGGPFFDAFGTERASWHTLSIDAFATPNLKGLIPLGMSFSGSEYEADNQRVELLEKMPPELLEQAERPYLTRRAWVLEKWLEWGVPRNPLWDSRVMARFPKQAPDSLNPLSWLEAAKQRDTTESKEPVEAGIDVAGPGEDETVLTIRRGPDILDQKTWLEQDPRGQALAELDRWRERCGVGDVKVDSVGIGYYFGLHLQDHGYTVHLVNVGLPARDKERYANLRSELFWAVRMRLEAGDLNGLVDEVALSQLASLRYRTNARGQIEVASKDEMRDKYKVTKSPDRAESIMLAFAPPQGDANRTPWFPGKKSKPAPTR